MRSYQRYKHTKICQQTSWSTVKEGHILSHKKRTEITLTEDRMSGKPNLHSQTFELRQAGLRFVRAGDNNGLFTGSIGQAGRINVRILLLKLKNNSCTLSSYYQEQQLWIQRRTHDIQAAISDWEEYYGTSNILYRYFEDGFISRPENNTFEQLY